jgi:hypothetical protein
MKIITVLFAGLLFFLLSPNILLRLPKNGNKFTVAGVHAVVFTFVLYFFNSIFHRLVDGIMNSKKEGLSFSDAECNEPLELNPEGNEDNSGPYMKDENSKCIPNPNI